jgi:hypothetical protein
MISISDRVADTAAPADSLESRSGSWGSDTHSSQYNVSCSRRHTPFKSNPDLGPAS